MGVQRAFPGDPHQVGLRVGVHPDEERVLAHLRGSGTRVWMYVCMYVRTYVRTYGCVYVDFGFDISDAGFRETSCSVCGSYLLEVIFPW